MAIPRFVAVGLAVLIFAASSATGISMRLRGTVDSPPGQAALGELCRVVSRQPFSFLAYASTAELPLYKTNNSLQISQAVQCCLSHLVGR